MTDKIEAPVHNVDDLLTPSVLGHVKEYLQNIDADTLSNLSPLELKEYIRDAIRIILIERDNFGYTMEELEFYVPFRFKFLTEVKSKDYIKNRIRETVKDTKYISVAYARVFGKDQKKFLVRE